MNFQKLKNIIASALSEKKQQPALDPRKKTGNDGEAAAAAMLRRKGYKIAARNYSCPTGEIDIVAKKRGLLVFVEVRTLKSDRHSHPLLTVNRAKQKKVISAARHYMRENKIFKADYRFDVVAIIWGTGEKPETIEHHEGAFSEAG